MDHCNITFTGGYPIMQLTEELRSLEGALTTHILSKDGQFWVDASTPYAGDEMEARLFLPEGYVVTWSLAEDMTRLEDGVKRRYASVYLNPCFDEQPVWVDLNCIVWYEGKGRMPRDIKTLRMNASAALSLEPEGKGGFLAFLAFMGSILKRYV